MSAPADELLPLLLAGGARDALAGTLPRGATLLEAEPRWVSYRPRRRVCVRYDAKVGWGDGATSEEMLVADYDRRGLAETARHAAVGGHEIAVWHAPADPDLPGLRMASDTGFARRLLNEVGINAHTVRLAAAAYRPRSRAVIEAEADLGVPRRITVGRGGAMSARSQTVSLFLKVVREAEAERIMEVHRRLEAVLPIPRCHHAGSGVLVLEGLPGRTLGRTLRRGLPAPSAEEVLRLTELIATVPLPGTAQADGAARSLRRLAELLRAVLPEATERLDRLEPLLAPRMPQPVESIHGDFHEGQVLVEDGRIAGLLDIDDAGPGERVDDVALMAARIWVTAQERADESIQAYADALLRNGSTLVDADELRRRVGISLLGRVTGPFRNQLRDWRSRALERLAIAERWVEGQR